MRYFNIAVSSSDSSSELNVLLAAGSIVRILERCLESVGLFPFPLYTRDHVKGPFYEKLDLHTGTVFMDLGL